MDAEEELARLRAVYMDRLKRMDSLAEASRRLGVNGGFLANQKAHKRGLRTGDALRSLRVLGNPLPEELYHEVFFSEDTDPARILAYSREHQNLKPDPFVVELLPRLEALAAAGPGPDGEWVSLDSEIRRLDRLRRRDRSAAKLQLEELIRKTLEPASLPRPAIADLSRAAGTLAAIYRLAGRRDDAVDLLVATRPLTNLANDFTVDADWLQKAAYLLVDLGRCSRALDFLQQAHILFDLEDSQSSRLRICVDFAYVMGHEHRYDEAKAILTAVLPRISESDHEYRQSAHQQLAVCLSELGDISNAYHHLNSAIELAGEDLLHKGYCLHLKAQLLAVNDDPAKALSSYRAALPLFANTTGAGELAELAMDYASLLLKLNRRQELEELATGLSKWIYELKGNLKLRAVIEDFRALMKLNNLTEGTMCKLREQVSLAIGRNSAARR